MGLAEAFRTHVFNKACRTILYWPIYKQAEVVTLMERLVKVLREP